MKKILVVTCSKTNGKDSKLVQSLTELKDDISLVINANSKCGLPEAYNRQLKADNLIKHDIVDNTKNIRINKNHQLEYIDQTENLLKNSYHNGPNCSR